MNYTLGVGSDGEVKDCALCRHSSTWPRFDPKTFRVCNRPEVLEITKGPRSCNDIARANDRLCGIKGRYWQAKPRGED